MSLEAEAAATLSLAERARRAIDDTDLQTALAKVTAALGAEGTAARTDPDMVEKRRPCWPGTSWRSSSPTRRW